MTQTKKEKFLHSLIPNGQVAFVILGEGTSVANPLEIHSTNQPKPSILYDKIRRAEFKQDYRNH